jgi:predicted MPP superfamily phosphohydrolase
LRNEIVEVEGLQIVGMDDVWARRFHPVEALSAIDSTRAALALSHNPDTADRPGWECFHGWILAGHTHGGQCKPPFLPPPVLPVHNRLYTCGEFALSGERKMYISRGVGHLLQVRFNVRPEVTVFELQSA